jgi:Type IIA topoisomerase (DNA gyrase/topo II, topoisomerase IV), A subunit
VITLIRRAQSPDEARAGLMRQFRAERNQSTAILEMRLQRLTQLERNKLIEEYTEVLKQIERLKSILAATRWFVRSSKMN